MPITQFDVDQQQQTARQAALNTALNGFAALEKEAKTKREQALQDQTTAFEFRKAGYDVSPEMIAQQRAEEPSGLAKLFGAKSPEKADLFGKRTEEYKTKLAQDADDRKFKRQKDMTEMEFQLSQIARDDKYKAALIRSMGVDDEKKLAEAEKLRSEAKVGPKLAQNEYAAANYSKRARTAHDELSKMPSDVGTGSWGDTIQNFGLFPEAMKTDQRKKLDQVERNFISAVLRKESGASISDTEYENERKKYFPMPGDNQELLAMKAQAREQAIMGLEAEGAQALPRIANAQKPITPATQTGSGITNQAQASGGAGPWAKYGGKK